MKSTAAPTPAQKQFIKRVKSYSHGADKLLNMLITRFPKMKSRLGVLEIGAGHKCGILSSSYAKIEVQHASLLGLSAQQLASHKGISVTNSSRVDLDHHTSLVRIISLCNIMYCFCFFVHRLTIIIPDTHTELQANPMQQQHC